MFKKNFISALAERKFVVITFNSIEKGIITRKCVPMDYGPLNRSTKADEFYHVLDLESPSGKIHPIAIREENMIALQILNEKFEPEEYVTWEIKNPWHVARDWEQFS